MPKLLYAAAMLTHLAIRNVAVIVQVDLAFGDGFTALTGETGAGKSLLMDALGLALGARADAGLIRHGQAMAEVTATFRLPEPVPPALAALLADQGLELEDGGALTLRRQLRKGAAEGGVASRAWVHATPVPLVVLGQIAAHLVDVHAQHAQQTLLEIATQRDLLDALAGLQAERGSVKAAWEVFFEARKAREAAEQAFAHACENAALLEAWRGELEALAYVPGEEEILAARKARASHAAKLVEYLAVAEKALAGASLHVAGKALDAAVRLDASLEPLTERLHAATVELNDLAASLADAGAAMEHPEDPEALDDRLHALKDVARKHHVEIAALPEVLARLTEQTSNLEALQAAAGEAARVEREAQAAYLAACGALVAGRDRAFGPLEARLQAALAGLHLPHARLSLSRRDGGGAGGPAGPEVVELLLAANPGSPAQPLGKVASGGELSRIMLAVKSVLFEGLPPQTVVLDEIDTGLSGGTASAVGAAMAAMGGKHQVLAITHHAQTAAHAHQHVKLVKQVEQGQTSTQLQPLTGPARVEELARLLAGANITPQARAAAQALLEESGFMAVRAA